MAFIATFFAFIADFIGAMTGRQSEELSNTNSLSQITCMFMMNHQIHIKALQIMIEDDLLDFCPRLHILKNSEEFQRHFTVAYAGLAIPRMSAPARM